MRVLLACVAGSQQHLNCLLPLARAAVAAGDEVALASGPDRVAEIRRYGLTFYPVGASFEVLVALAGREAPAYRLGGENEEVLTYTHMFGAVAGPRTARDLLDVLSDFRPDLVIHEAAEFGAPLAATVKGIPFATLTYGLPVPVACLEAAGAALAPAWERYGLVPDPYGGAYRHLAVDIFPQSLRGCSPVHPAAGHRDVRPKALAVPGQGALDSWVRLPADRPIVHVSFGTAAWNRAVTLMRSVVEALSDEDVTVVTVVGPGQDPGELGRLPGNAVARPFVPHGLLLPHCQAVVTHGGAGTTLAALEHGVPLLVLPQGADQFRTADAVEAAAAGLAVRGAVPAEAVRAGVQLLLRHPVLRAGAARVAEEIAVMPAPADALAAIKAALGAGS